MMDGKHIKLVPSYTASPETGLLHGMGQLIIYTSYWIVTRYIIVKVLRTTESEVHCLLSRLGKLSAIASNRYQFRTIFVHLIPYFPR